MSKRISLTRKQKGQAMVFSLLFFAVAIMTLLILYNQGQLVKNRVQLENAADAAVYSQAKLAARNLNFIAYTNRAMVANEVSIGQMVALLSWVKHYKNVGAFSFFPLYTVPIAPPSPTTLQSIMAPITAVYTQLGTALEPPLRQVNKVWPTAISYFNGALGIFQKVFALSTLESEIEMNLEVVKDHEFSADSANSEMYTPVVGWYFFVQNTLLTYFGENVSPDTLYSNLSGKLDSNAANADGHDMVGDFLGGQLGTVDNMINDNTSGVSRKKSNNSSGGQNANLNTDAEDTGDSAVDGYKRFAAIVNNNREAFTRDRHWDLGPPRVEFHFPLVLDVGIVKLTIKLDLGFWAGIKNDGGTAYVAQGSIEEDKDIASLGWSALDVTSFGIQIDIGLFVSFEVCLPVVGCNGGTILDVDFSIPIGLPLAGATHQLVSDRKYAKKTVPEWGYPLMPADVYGGDINDVLNQGSFDLFHLVALGWGSVAPQLPGGMFGTNPADVTDTYSGPPSFFSLGDSFQESGVGYEFVIALAKSMDEIETTDKSKPSDSGASPSFLNINTGSPTDWDDPNNNPVDYTRFDVESHSRVEGADISADYQELVWNDERPMMTVSAAETYFADPMQKNKDGSDVAPSLFSPFWDARLKEPSAISMLIATGEIQWSEIFEGLSDNASANDIIDWVLNGIAERVVEVGVDTLIEQIDDPIIGPLIEPTINDVATQATDVAIDQLPDFDGLMP
tara:strand:- start:619 stop:2817 length:2199 start_codon:yes stop_codon:yes gene_type:complete